MPRKDQSHTAEDYRMEMNEIKNDEFRTKGYVIVRNVLSPVEVETMRQHADAIAADLEGYNARDNAERASVEARYPMSGPDSVGEARAKQKGLDEYPEIRLTDRHARRENRVYPVRRRPVDPDERAATATDDPYSSFSGQISHLADNDEYFRSIAAHPNIVSVLNEVLSPNAKLWFDHIYNKAPLNDDPPYAGSNRYHQDGFFHLSKRSATCWISLDGLTIENGPFHYITIQADYPQFGFDDLGEEAIGEKELSQEEVITLNPGDAAFHDRWTLHATGPNESTKRRRGWALHYADATSRFGEYSGASDDPDQGFAVTPEGYHIRHGSIHGNRFWHLVSGREFEGCV